MAPSHFSGPLRVQPWPLQLTLPTVSYPPQPPGPGWPPQQPTPGQPPEQSPFAAADPHGPGPQSSGYEQYSLEPQSDPGQQNWGQPTQPYGQPYGQSYGQPGPEFQQSPMSGPPASGAPMSGAPMSGAPMSGPPPYQPGGRFGPPPKKRSALPFLLGGVALLIVVAVVVGVVVFVNRSTDDGNHRASTSGSPSPSGSPSASASPSAPAAAGDGVQGDHIVDTATGWFFKKRDGDWKDTVNPAASELLNPVGQTVSLSGGLSACIEIGQLRSDFHYTGPSDLEDVKSALATSILKNYYGHGAKVDPKQKHTDQKLTQYGRKAWLWAFHVNYTSSAGSATGEYVVIAVLDAGNGKAAAFWGSVPNGHDTLKKDMMAAAGTLNVQS